MIVLQIWFLIIIQNALYLLMTEFLQHRVVLPNFQKHTLLLQFLVLPSLV